MSVLLWTFIGVATAVLILRTRKNAVGFKRHILVGAVVAVSAGIIYSAVAKVDIWRFDASRSLLTLIAAVLAVYLSLGLAQTSENYKRR